MYAWFQTHPSTVNYHESVIFTSRIQTLYPHLFRLIPDTYSTFTESYYKKNFKSNLLPLNKSGR